MAPYFDVSVYQFDECGDGGGGGGGDCGDDGDECI